jgi:hypothetical protein
MPKHVIIAVIGDFGFGISLDVLKATWTSAPENKRVISCPTVEALANSRFPVCMVGRSNSLLLRLRPMPWVKNDRDDSPRGKVLISTGQPWFPAELKRQDRSALSDETLKRFETLFARINSTIGK